MKLEPLVAVGVLASTALTDAVYVLFNAAVAQRRRLQAASWSSIWYLLSAFAVISYTHNAGYVIFAAGGSWIGAFCAMTWLRRGLCDLRREREKSNLYSLSVTTLASRKPLSPRTRRSSLSAIRNKRPCE